MCTARSQTLRGGYGFVLIVPCLFHINAYTFILPFKIYRFGTGRGVQSLTAILKAYAVTDPEVGYCQGMNFIAGVLLMYLPSEADAYAGLCVLMQQRGLRELYKEDLAHLQVSLHMILPRVTALRRCWARWHGQIVTYLAHSFTHFCSCKASDKARLMLYSGPSAGIKFLKM